MQLTPSARHASCLAYQPQEPRRTPAVADLLPLGPREVASTKLTDRNLMDNALKCFLSVSLLLTACADPEPPKSRSITHEGMSIDIPANWTSKKVKDPQVFDVGDPKTLLFLIVVREPKRDMGVENLEEYFEFKFENLSEGWQEKRFGQRKSFILHSRKAILVDGSATVEEPKDLPTTFYFMTVEGVNYYYFAYLLNPVKGGLGMPELRTIIESLKVP
jgi:hypothetical protein